jgi:hypothetical protein
VSTDPGPLQTTYSSGLHRSAGLGWMQTDLIFVGIPDATRAALSICRRTRSME